MSSTKFLSMLLVSGSVLLSSCGGGKPAAEHKQPDEARSTVSVKTVLVQTATLPEIYEATGTIRSRTATTLSARAMGHLREVRVRVGERVKAGQVLAVLDSREIESGYSQAESGLAEARAGLPESENGIAAAKASLDLAEATHKRMKSLYDSKSISEHEYDEVQARLTMARANHQMAIAKKTQLESKIRQAQQAVERAGVQKSYSDVTAPFAGIITERKAEPGTLASPGVPLFILEQTGAYRLEVPIEESRLGTVRIGSKATVVIDSLGREVEARVTEIVPSLDPGSRTFLAKLDVPNMPNLQSGIFGRARFPVGSRETLLVPAGAVSKDGQMTRVYVLENKEARGRLVTTGAMQNGSYEVLSGLRAGEALIAPLPPGIADGAPVEVRQ